MNELLQPAQHPDADQLTAFVEHALPAHEREQTLAHLATCATCRQLVFLAQPEQPVEVAQAIAARKPWFAGWNLVWPAAAALAGIVAVSAYLRRPAPVANKPPEVAIVTEVPPVPPAPALLPDLPLVAPKALPPSRTGPVPATSAMPRPLPLDAPERNRVASQMTGAGQAQNQSVALAQKQEAMPSAPLQEHQASQQQVFSANRAPAIPAQNYVTPVAAAPPAKASAAVASRAVAGMPQAAPPPPPVTLGQTMRAAAAAAPAPPKPAAAPQETVQVSSATVAVETMDATNSLVLTELPGGRPTLSKVSNGSRTVALDSSGALFVSKDAGKHWKEVKAAWTGRAVRLSQDSADAPLSGLAAQRASTFRLTTDAGSVWTSTDGQKWKRQ